jgi:hypothetical protein
VAQLCSPSVAIVGFSAVDAVAEFSKLDPFRSDVEGLGVFLLGKVCDDVESINPQLMLGAGCRRSGVVPVFTGCGL